MGREYRRALGFTNQEKLKGFYKANDIRVVNWTKIDMYNERICEMFRKINSVIVEEFRMSDQEFAGFKEIVNEAYTVLKNTRIIEDKLNNNGRSPESVYYNWMRGYAVGAYFSKVISRVFNADADSLIQLGKDNLQEVATSGDRERFKREAIADFEIVNTDIHIEVQAGFTGDNDIKRSKAKDAKVRRTEGKRTFVVHFDLFNGRLAVINITSLEDNLPEDHWIENAKFEGVYTTPIPTESFKWCITTAFPENEIISVIA